MYTLKIFYKKAFYYKKIFRKLVDPKLHKFSEILNEFKINIHNAYEPSKDLCIDETLYSFRGRCQMKQYMPSKPAKYGLKYNSIVDAKNAYMLNTELYAGERSVIMKV